MTYRYRYEFTFTSDWHVGTGAGRSGHLDRLVAKDRDGFPYLPAKSVTGIWRDAAARLARALDTGEAPAISWSELVEVAFGSRPSREVTTNDNRAPRPAKLSIRSAFASSEFVDAVQSCGHLSAVTTVRTSTAIDPLTGVAAGRTLRMIEVARAGSTLIGEMTLDLAGYEEEASQRIADLVIGASQLIHGIGGSRRRGLGRCEVSVWQADPGTSGTFVDVVGRSIERLTTKNGSDSQSVATVPPHTAESIDLPLAPTTFTIDLDLITLAPVVAARQQSGNVISSSDHPTGTMLLPAICAALRRAGIDADSMVRAGHLAISNAVPLIDGQSSLPMPFALSREKSRSVAPVAEEPEDVAGAAAATLTGSEPIRVFDTLVDRPEGVQAKQLRGGWVALSDHTGETELEFATVERLMQTHSTIDDESQRPTSDVGGVFSYQAIAPGQCFRSTLTVNTDEAQGDLIVNQLAHHETGLGTSRKDQYGLVRFAARRTSPVSAPSSVESGGSLVVWCVSDAVVLGKDLRPQPTVEGLRNELASRLGIPSESLVPDPNAIRMRAARHDGWHGRWGLPKSSIVSIAAGSVVRFTTAVALEGDLLAQVSLTGLGERTAEGFGRVVINHRLLGAKAEWTAQSRTVDTQLAATVDTQQTAWRPARAAAANAVASATVGNRLVDAIATDAARTLIAEAVEMHAGNVLPPRALGSLAPTQLGHLRQLVRDGSLEGDAARWLRSDTTTKNWRSAGAGAARTQLLELMENPELIWGHLEITGAQRSAQLARDAIQALLEHTARTRTRGKENDT
jgi:CRISPR-associated protein Csx10